MSYSESIDKAVQEAVADGNAVADVSTGWTKVREVIMMEKPLSNRLRLLLDKNNRLRFWSTEATPHNRAEDGYTDDIDKVAIAFPRL